MKGIVRELAAEFLGTFVLIVFGTAVVAQVVLSHEKNGQYLSINLGWGLGVTMGMFIAHWSSLTNSAMRWLTNGAMA